MTGLTGVILAGGTSERFGGAAGCPKPAVDLAGAPLVLHVGARLAAAGCEKIVVLTAENHDQLRSRLGLSSRFGQLNIAGKSGISFELRFSGREVATGGRLAYLQKEELGDNALLSYTDVFSDCDLTELIAVRQAANASLAVLAVNPRQPWGLITMDQNRIAAFREKPTLPDCWINGGIFAADASLLDAIKRPDDQLEDQVMQRLITRNAAVAMRHARWWRSIDTPKDVRAAMKEDLAHFAFSPDHQPRLAPVPEHVAKAKT